MKNILKVAFVAAIAVATGIQVFNAQKTEALPEVAMANVEALAADDDTLLSKDCEVIVNRMKDIRAILIGVKILK